MPTPFPEKSPYVTCLRLYEPLDALSPAARRRLLRALARQDGPAGETPPGGQEEWARAEFARSRRRVALSPARPVPAREGTAVLTLRTADGLCVWPWQVRLLSWYALDALEDSLPPVAFSAMVPASVREEVGEARESWLAAGGDGRARTRLATWEVPLAWFALFPARGEGAQESEPEIQVSYGRRGARGPFANLSRTQDPPVVGLRWRTPARQAARRAAWALARASRALPDSDLTEDLTSLVEWLGLFDERSVVELDYGSFGAVVHPDETALDLRMGLESLDAGDLTVAAACHARITRRWLSVRAAARAS